MITAITCTGHRLEAFKLCHTYMTRQTYKDPIQWIVVTDDNPEELKHYLKVLPKHITPELYQGPEDWKPGMNTYAGNMLTALEHVKGDRILFFEDDDWYSAGYIEHMVKLLNFAEIAAEMNSSYYNLAYPGFKRMQNYVQASLCQTGIQTSMIPYLEKAINSGNKYFDIELWKATHRHGISCVMFADLNLCIGMKGMPGRAGIGSGHVFDGYTADPYLVILKRWLGEDHKFYLPYAKGLEHGKKDETPGVQKSAVVNSKKGRSLKGQSGSNLSSSNQAR